MEWVIQYQTEKHGSKQEGGNKHDYMTWYINRKIEMKKKIVIFILVLLSGFLSINQLDFIRDKHSCFIEEYNQQLWENRIAESSIKLCYFLTFICLLLAIFGFRMKVFKSVVLIYFTRFLLIISFLCSLTASIWMYNMHSKKEVVGYNEWIQHKQQTAGE